MIKLIHKPTDIWVSQIALAVSTADGSDCLGFTSMFIKWASQVSSFTKEPDSRRRVFITLRLLTVNSQQWAASSSFAPSGHQLYYCFRTRDHPWPLATAFALEVTRGLSLLAAQIQTSTQRTVFTTETLSPLLQDFL